MRCPLDLVAGIDLDVGRVGGTQPFNTVPS